MFIAFMSCATWALASSGSAATAFFYGQQIPVSELLHYQRVVLQPDYVREKDLERLQAGGVAVYAYLSMGEITAANARKFNADSSWFAAKNSDWASHVFDMTNSDWQQWFIDSRVKQLHSQNFDGLFLDTMDSFDLFAEGDEQREQQLLGQQKVLQSVKAQFPTLKLFLNRGFDLIPRIPELIEAVAAESLYHRWDAGAKAYKPVPEGDREWLLTKLIPLQEQGIDVTVIDYVPADNPALRAKTRDAILEHKFAPWVANPALDQLGAGVFTNIPRRVLVIYDSKIGRLAYHPAHTQLGNTFDYLGLRADYHDVRAGLPNVQPAGLYAGVVTYLNNSSFTNLSGWEQWLIQRIEEKLPVVFFEGFPFRGKELAGLIGIESGVKTEPPMKLVENSRRVGEFEAAIKLPRRPYSAVNSVSEKNTEWVSLRGKQERRATPILTGQWGGIALSPFTSRERSPQMGYWVLDTVEFFAEALQVSDLPRTDSTTENGNRILLSYVDGDGFVSRAEFPGSPYSAEIILKQVLEPYQLPHTISIVEGEVGPEGLYPEQTPALESWAKKIFALENVEAASHSFSHPFFWQPEKIVRLGVKKLYGDHMPIPGYKLDFEREVKGSIDYIQTLLPAGKKVEVMLWTGDANPSGKVIGITNRLGVQNMNGANTKPVKQHPSATLIYPQLRATSGGIHVYAPIMNENVYTNDWTGPFYGFKRVLETFELTEHPRRHKPISIYWHFYSGTKKASLNALHTIYKWAEKQSINAMYVSEYSPKIEGTYYTSLAETQRGSIRVKGLGALRTLRITDKNKYPDLEKSTGVAGYFDSHDGRYIHLTADTAELFWQATEPREAFLKSANAQIVYWNRKGTKEVELQLRGHEPLEIEIGARSTCKLKLDGQWLSGKREKRTTKFTLKRKDTGHALLVC